MSSLTDEFRRVLPFGLYSSCPKLSALHETRRKLLSLKSTTPDSNIPSTWCCPKCGLIQLTGQRRDSMNPLNGLGTSRSLKKSKKALSRPIVGVGKCPNCGATPSHRLTSTAKHSMPSVRHMKNQRSRMINSETESPTPETPMAALSNGSNVGTMSNNPATVSTTQSTKPTGGSTGKSRPKKHVGLQEMLARNRSQREKNAAETKLAGLADFLVGL
jgi:predicted RNA-binding Zn-ribbon protein involved in translation (DUF1610 family)